MRRDCHRMRPCQDHSTIRLTAALGVFMLGTNLFGQVRRPAVAGAFYPGDRATVERDVAAYLHDAPAEPAPSALIAPHAGYVFSGATAGKAFAGLIGSHVKRVILLGPSHRMDFIGAALPAPAIKAFATPLGELPVDQSAVATLRSQRYFDGPERAHDAEHSLEVELPFLQETVGSPAIVPILIGHRTNRAIARALARAIAPLLDDGTIVVVSSDFTHHGAAYGYAPFGADASVPRALVALGRATASRAAAIDPRGFWQQVDVAEDTVCGARPIEVLLELLAHAFSGEGRVVGVTTSADVSRDWNQVVAYAAVTFTGRWTAWRDEPSANRLGALSTGEERAALELARAALATHLTHEGQLARWFAEHTPEGNLLAPAGVFVTLNRRGQAGRRKGELRGCIGTLEAREPLVDAIVHSAVSAAHDPRFPALTAGELKEITIEISVLSPLRRVSGPDAVRIGTDGVLLTKDGYQAVFLPQVATEFGWSLDTLLTQLSVKAGLPPDGWRHGAQLETFTAQVFGERE
jgi:MEMO1 family protein